MNVSAHKEIDLTFDDRLQEAVRFHMGMGDVHATLRTLITDLDEAGIDYAVVGGMALNAHGYRRETIDIDVLVRPEALDVFHKKCVGRGYLPAFEAARKSFRSTRTKTPIDFVTTGEFPGDGKPKDVAFPDPATACEVIDGVKVATLPVLINLKLASGMTNPGRVRDLADVQELIRVLALPADFAAQLDPFVRPTFGELWQGLQGSDRPPG
ncbi:MAG: hypothetical protein IT450_20215 [Phycisphaerales bacterium]|nr:hypothetical protein [Phycisphaerales bacterium]